MGKTIQDYRRNKSCGKRKRCCEVPPANLWTKGGYSRIPTVLYKDLGNPNIYVQLYGKNKEDYIWCADPDFLRKALNTIRELIGRNQRQVSKTHAEKWFGEDVDVETIRNSAGELHTYLETTLSDITFQCTLDWGMASMDQRFYRNHQSHPKCRLDRGYYWNRFHDGEIIAGILHEMIHCVLDPNKQWSADGDTCEGITDCLALAKKDQGTALENVDNWTFYFFEEKGGLSNTLSIDWECMDEVSFSKRPKLEPNEVAPF
ncbi:MAG: hypothetical protein QNI99_18285 [Woeseiaceae bacterium]|nr:hypothetical protein [Woeseiaceae bacterium]